MKMDPFERLMAIFIGTLILSFVAFTVTVIIVMVRGMP